MVRGGRPLLIACLALLVPLLTGGVLAAVALFQVPLRSAIADQPVIAEVTAAQHHQEQPVPLTFVPAGRQPLRSQARGMVTALMVEPGASVAQGQEVLRIDARPVFALVAPAPLHEEVTAQTQGENADVVRQFLSALGHLSSDVEGPGSVAAAIVSFNQATGRSGEVFHPSSVIWIPESAVIADVTVHIGDVVAPQDEILTATVDADRIRVGSDPVEENRRITLGAVTVSLPAGQNDVTADEDVAALKEAMGEATSQTGFLSVSTPQLVGTIPASAVVTDAQGRSCFFPGVSESAMPLTAVAGTFGMVQVPADLIGSPVLVNPRQVRQESTCS